jgi:SAM-dependent methyltransferase
MQQTDSTPTTRESYDRVASKYADLYLHEFDHKPFDRDLLDRFAERVKSRGRVMDLGCGPGQVAAYLHKRGVDAFGVDLSPEMVKLAKEANPGVEFREGDMRSPGLPDESLAGITAFYSLIHIPRREVSTVVRGLRRVLQPGGLLLAAFHKGEGAVHRDEFLDEHVSLDFAFFEPQEMEIYLRAGGFLIEDVLERQPYPDVEYPSQRAYIIARKPERRSR